MLSEFSSHPCFFKKTFCDLSHWKKKHLNYETSFDFFLVHTIHVSFLSQKKKKDVEALSSFKYHVITTSRFWCKLSPNNFFRVPQRISIRSFGLPYPSTVSTPSHIALLPFHSPLPPLPRFFEQSAPPLYASILWSISNRLILHVSITSLSLKRRVEGSRISKILLVNIL